MGSYGEDQFFDTREDLSSVSDWGEDCCEDCSSIGLGFVKDEEVWAKNLDSVHERRHKFLQWMGVDLDRNLIMAEEPEDVFVEKVDIGIDRIKEDSGVVLRTSGLEEASCSSQSTVSSVSNEDRESRGNGALDDNCGYAVRNLNHGMDIIVNELGLDGRLCRLGQAGLNQLINIEEIRTNHAPAPSPSIQQFLQSEVDNAKFFLDAKKKVKRGWLRKLGIGICVVDKHEAALTPRSLKSASGTGMRRVRVHPNKKRTKELSSLYAGQDFSAHEGSILSMKFSLDGKYLASAGKDGIVRVWEVIEDERLAKFDIAGDPSSLYFKMNPFSKLDSQDVDKEKQMRRSSDSACVIFPPKIFRLSEKPLHEFRGHSGEVLDLSWSKKGFLLSSSVDKTVRLWQVGCDRCLRVFSHNDYVTCVNFNPLDDDYFISGSIDGKVRIWEIIRCLVVDYIDVREIVTAVSYRPDGKGGIVGFVTGNCCFFTITDNQLELDAQISIQGKKKSPGKRITGFQFCPSNSSKVMVTSADSVVRVISATDIVCKFRVGLRNGGIHMSASFTSDGKHIVSASEDSNVHIWNYNSQDMNALRARNIRSCESFVSHNSMIAIPWNGVNSIPGTLSSPRFTGDMQGRTSLDNPLKHLSFDEKVEQKMHLSSPDCFSLSRGFLLEALPRGTATWPEEKLISSSPVAVAPTMCKSEYRFLKAACQSMSGSSHMWGLVIVTAGWDGRIRTYHNYGLPIRR